MAKLNRRNVLIGMGTIVAGGGAALGTGAFSQVDADRTVNITTAGDGSANLQFTVNDGSDGITGTDTDGVKGINLANLNRDAETTFDGALTVTNGSSDEVTLEITETTGSADVTFEDSGTDLSQSSITLGDSSSVDLDLVVSVSDSSDNGDVDVTFRATKTNA